MAMTIRTLNTRSEGDAYTIPYVYGKTLSTKQKGQDMAEAPADTPPCATRNAHDAEHTRERKRDKHGTHDTQRTHERKQHWKTTGQVRSYERTTRTHDSE